MGAILIAISFLVGLVYGYAADRLAARWPEHEDGAIRGHRVFD